ncbi:MAG: hypothetical protein AAB564_01785 [Patescibacteria group bacterium]
MKILIIGLGTIGEPLARIFLDQSQKIGAQEIIVHKNTPDIKHRGALRRICEQGAKLAVYEDHMDEFKKVLRPSGLKPYYTFLEALARADVVINCTKAGIGNKMKLEYYKSLAGAGANKLFIAQGSENGFGKPYAHGINDQTLKPSRDQFIQIVSCNTHQILSILHTLALISPRKIEKARFWLGRRASDLSQANSTIGVEVGVSNGRYGSHQGKDAAGVLASLGLKNIDLHASADKLNNPFMHTIYFSITASVPTALRQIKKQFYENPLTAVTYRQSNNEIFNEGRSWGYCGRILNQTVVCLPSLQVISGGREIIGRCFTPQDGNVILSSVAATLWFADPVRYLKKMREIFYQPPYLFKEI